MTDEEGKLLWKPFVISIALGMIALAGINFFIKKVLTISESITKFSFETLVLHTGSKEETLRSRAIGYLNRISSKGLECETSIIIGEERLRLYEELHTSDVTLTDQDIMLLLYELNPRELISKEGTTPDHLALSVNPSKNPTIFLTESENGNLYVHVILDEKEVYRELLPDMARKLVNVQRALEMLEIRQENQPNMQIESISPNNSESTKIHITK